MKEEVLLPNSFLEPGYIYAPVRATQLCAVVAYGVVITIFDFRRRMGGMCHYLFPYREVRSQSTAKYAAPAIVTLARMFLNTGSKTEELEAQVFGGAQDPKVADASLTMLGKQNIQVGEELLAKLGIPVVGHDVGGSRGRKIVFTSSTGETAVLKVNRLRNTDWTQNPYAKGRREIW